MIEVENAGRWRSEASYDRFAALLIGMVAILAATFAIQQAHFGLAGQRAQIMGGRLSVAISTRMSASSTADAALLGAQQQALVLGMTSVGRQMAGTSGGEEAVVAIGAAEQLASQDLQAVIATTAGTTGKAPLDRYTAGLVTSELAMSAYDVEEQNRQVDLAQDLGGREQQAVLGLSLVALAGVLAGVAAVLGRSVAGWGTLVMGWIVVAVATVQAVGALL